LAFIPRSGATSAGVIASISVYQSTSCHRVGRLRNARALRLRSRASIEDASFVSGSSKESRVSSEVSRRDRPHAAAVFRMVVNRYGRKAPVGPFPRRTA
jgi:hypothetical protein